MTPPQIHPNNRVAGGAQTQKRIYLITHEFYPKHGGIATFAEEIARAATTLGHDVEVWAQAASSAREKQWPFRIHRLPIKGTHDLACRARLALEMILRRRHLRNAIVYMPEPGPVLTMMSLQYIKTFRPKQLFLTFHGSEILRFHANPRHRMLLNDLIEKATRISTLTDYTRELLCNCFPAARGKTILTPGALRTDLPLDGGNGETAGSRTRAPFPADVKKDKRIVLTVGRIHPRKGQLQTLRALQALPQPLRAGTEYWIVGKLAGTKYEKELRLAAARSSGVAVRFLGEVPDHKLGEVYARADIFAMTSINYRSSIEGFGLVYLEASAHGLPVVAHDVGGVAEAVIDGETGFVVRPAEGDSMKLPNLELTAAFEKLLVDSSLRRRMGAAGKKHARGTSWLESAKKLFAPPDVALGGV